MHVHLLPIEDSPALGVTAGGLRALTGEPFYVHFTLYLEREVQSHMLESQQWSHRKAQRFVKGHYE